MDVWSVRCVYVHNAKNKVVYVPVVQISKNIFKNVEKYNNISIGMTIDSSCNIVRVITTDRTGQFD